MFWSLASSRRPQGALSLCELSLNRRASGSNPTLALRLVAESQGAKENRQQAAIPDLRLACSLPMVVYGLALGNQRQLNGGDFSTRIDELWPPAARGCLMGQRPGAIRPACHRRRLYGAPPSILEASFLCAIRLISLRPVKKYAKNLNEIVWPTPALEIHVRNSAMYPVHS
jgi:hypothetical protein